MKSRQRVMLIGLTLLAALLGSGASAQTTFFTIWPGHPDFAPQPTSTIPGVEVEYPVAVDIRELVRNRAARDSYRLRFDDGNDRVFSQQRFEAIEGFIELGSLDIQPDPRLPESAISYYWYGLSGNETLFIAVVHGQLSLSLSGRDKTYAITRSHGQLVWRRFDPRLVPPDVDGEASANPPELSAGKAAPRPKFLDFVDVLVLHTPAALAAAGGSQAQLDAEIGAAFMQSELAWSNSGVTSVRLRNVSGGSQSLLINYNENPPTPVGCTSTIPGFCRWIGHRVFLRTNGIVQDLRNSAGADLVVVADQANATGVSYVQRPDCGNEPSLEETSGCSVGTGYNSFAVAAVSLPFLTSFQVFAHETGHQLGMEHNVNAQVVPSFPWSFGWFVNGQNETILSVRNGTASCPNLGCPRAIQYSNPNVPFLGSTVPSGAANAFNARTAAALAPAVSEFRNPVLTGLMFRSDFEALPVS